MAKPEAVPYFTTPLTLRAAVTTGVATVHRLMGTGLTVCGLNAAGHLPTGEHVSIFPGETTCKTCIEHDHRRARGKA